jgi:hypothetical protein
MANTTKRASVFNKLATKEKVVVTKSRQSVALVQSEIDKNAEIKRQLEELIEQNEQKDFSASPQSLQAASWFNTKIRDQLSMIAERNIQLEQERETLMAELIRAERRRSQKQEKAEELLAKARQERQSKADQSLSELVSARRR